MPESRKAVSTGEMSGQKAYPRATVLLAVPLTRLRMRPSFMQRQDPLAFLHYLCTLAHPSLCPGEEPREGERYTAPIGLVRSPLAARPVGSQTDKQLVAHKELAFLYHRRRAVPSRREQREQDWDEV